MESGGQDPNREITTIRKSYEKGAEPSKADFREPLAADRREHLPLGGHPAAVVSVEEAEVRDRLEEGELVARDEAPLIEQALERGEEGELLFCLGWSRVACSCQYAACPGTSRRNPSRRNSGAGNPPYRTGTLTETSTSVRRGRELESALPKERTRTSVDHVSHWTPAASETPRSCV